MECNNTTFCDCDGNKYDDGDEDKYDDNDINDDADDGGWQILDTNTVNT